jgi:hypothetical protein
MEMTNKVAKIQAKNRLKFIRFEDCSGVPNRTSNSQSVLCAIDPIDSDHDDNRDILPFRPLQSFQSEKTPIIGWL